ncbi:EF-hand domain-containing family member C2-like [Phymastichus coffea]|uniref:EF-hand domain-containing family member C2-like n=1 Tax=Phymastichus coffea TaxID=108790 RepID=UPI00273AD02D|nr:EF-hand domain-containing family member C2-like [Phymastichus coffea]
MNRAPQFPRLPGFNFDQNIGRTKFNKSQLFDRVHGNVYYLAEKPNASGDSRYPALYAWGEKPPGPTWLAFDGQRLMFKAYFQESLASGREPYRVRLVDISFFLEDGTMKVSEPSIENCGLEQGVLVRRQRIPLPDPVKYRYFDILDLNIGAEPQLFGRAYKIYDCDQFTRRFLNRMGIPVPDPISPPADVLRERKHHASTEKSHQKRADKLGKFLKYDRKVLRFYGFWDDSESPHGYVHELEILYYLADDTLEILESQPARHGASTRSLLVKRMKIPKFFANLEPVGSGDPYTLLNVMGDNMRRGYYIPDNSYRSRTASDYYKECDLAIGAQMDVFGRRVIIADLDEFTKDFYRKKYGLDAFTPIPKPGKRNDEGELCYGRYIPPYNGYGSYEDSLGYCFSVVPKKPKLLTDKFYRYENQVNDSRVLRFGCKMIDDRPENQERCFVINVYLFDKTIAIAEVTYKKPGHTKSLFQKKMRVRLPGEEIFTSSEPKYYEPADFYVGACVNLSCFKFYIESADEYTFKYMEQHCDEFPKADIKTILSKVREKLRCAYRQFTSEYPPVKVDDDADDDADDEPPTLSLYSLRKAMREYVGECISEHEIMTIARHYSLQESRQPYPRDHIRALVHTELTRLVWNDLDRLEEDICAWDRDKTGYLGRDQLYTLLRANRIPLQRELIRLMLDYVEKNSEGKIKWRDLINFLDIKVDPLPPVVPMNLKEVYWTIEEKPRDCSKIDYCAFLKDLGLESEVKDLVSQMDDK